MSKLLDKKTYTPEQLAQHHNISIDEINQQLKIGLKEEQEHTSDLKVAREIALDHLLEDPYYYYTKLKKVMSSNDYNDSAKLEVTGSTDSLSRVKMILENMQSHGSTGHSFNIAAVDGKRIEKNLGDWDGDGSSKLACSEIIKSNVVQAATQNLIFFDTEFYENGESINLISIGAVKPDGEQCYLINGDFDRQWFEDDAKKRGQHETIEFLNNNVFNNLGATKTNTFSLDMLTKIFVHYCGSNPVFWTSTGAYDWILIMQTFFGRMLDQPKDWPYMAMDTAQLKAMFPHVKKDMSLLPFAMPHANEHNALYDAAEVYAKYLSYKKYIVENNLPINI